MGRQWSRGVTGLRVVPGCRCGCYDHCLPGQGQHAFPVKAQTVSILGCMGPTVFVPGMTLCCCRANVVSVVIDSLQPYGL